MRFLKNEIISGILYIMSKIKILIIDDDPQTSRQARDFLKDDEYEILWVSSGKEGLKRLKIIKPDLILLDLVLPDFSGYKIAQELRLIPMCENIPIIAVSLKREDIDKHIALKSGIQEYVEKPIDFDRLTFLIKGALQR
jgi:DNA-binding response OmpR family regulator